MDGLVYFMIGCAVVGAIGMSIGNRKVPAHTAKQRWIKYFVYLVITVAVLVTMMYNYFFFLAAIIMLVGLYEVLFAFAPGTGNFFKVSALLIYAFIAAGFLLFSTHFDVDFVLAIYVQVLMFDAFSQVSGQIFGKRSLAPAISPGKTVEGFIGGMIVCLITAMAVSGILQVTVPIALAIGAITTFSALGGDLLASWFKRKMKIKDYSRLLPGQGGILDRFDSFIASGFVYFSLSQTVLIKFLAAWIE